MRDGKLCYTLQADDELSPDTAEALGALLAAIEEKTGVDPTAAEVEDGKNGKLVFTRDHTHYAETRALTAADYFIGFADGDLVICAKNDPLLTTAINAFKSQYITGDDAEIGNGFCYLSADTRRVGESSPLIDGGACAFTILCSYAADETTLRAAMALQAAIREATGLNMPIQRDSSFSPDHATSYEIIVGDSLRDASRSVEKETDPDAYRFETVGNKFLILAENSSTLERAVDDLISLFITAAAEAEDPLALPRDFYFRQKI